VFTENLAAGQVVPEPGRENFHFNLWLNGAAPVGNQPVEVTINDFQFIPLVPGDFDLDADVDSNDFSTWQRGSFGAVELGAWQANFGGSLAALSTAAVPEPSTGALLLTLSMLRLPRGKYPYLRGKPQLRRTAWDRSNTGKIGSRF